MANNNFNYVDDGGGQGSVRGADGSVLASGNIAGIMRLMSMLSIASALEARALRQKAMYQELNKILVATEPQTAFADARERPVRYLTTQASPGETAHLTSVSLDTTSAATLAEGVKYQLKRMGALVDGYIDSTQDCIDVLSAFVKSLADRELWQALGVNISDNVLLILGMQPGSPFSLSPSLPPVNV